MAEDFVTFEIAKKLKEEGFPQVTFGNYNMQSACYIEDGRFYENGCITEVSRAYTAPTISQVLKWLRKEKSIYVALCCVYDCNTDADCRIINRFTFWSFCIQIIETGDIIYSEVGRRFDFYEEAALAGIEYVLDNNLI